MDLFEDDDAHERLVNLVAEMEPVSTIDAARCMGAEYRDVHVAMLNLRDMGSGRYDVGGHGWCLA